jgi:hypothetical protein
VRERVGCCCAVPACAAGAVLVQDGRSRGRGAAIELRREGIGQPTTRGAGRGGVDTLSGAPRRAGGVESGGEPPSVAVVGATGAARSTRPAETPAPIGPAARPAARPLLSPYPGAGLCRPPPPAPLPLRPRPLDTRAGSLYSGTSAGGAPDAAAPGCARGCSSTPPAAAAAATRSCCCSCSCCCCSVGAAGCGPCCEAAGWLPGRLSGPGAWLPSLPAARSRLLSACFCRA